MTDAPSIKRKGKRSGRAPKLPAGLDDDFDADHMARAFFRHSASQAKGLSTMDIVRFELSKRGGKTVQQRALWLIEQERRRALDPRSAPSTANLPAVERWLRDPTASSYQAAMRPRKLRSVQATNLVPFAGKSR